MKPWTVSTVMNGRRFTTSTSTLLAHDAYQDERGCYERDGRNLFLYRTNKTSTYWLVEQKGGRAFESTELTQDAAVNTYELLPVKVASFDDAFFGAQIGEA